jgi:hypothetical protein
MSSGSPLTSLREAWWSASERTVVGSTMAVSIFLFFVIGAADRLMLDKGLSAFGIMLGDDALASVLAFGFTYGLAHYARQRRETVQRERNIIAETNHHIRNALELIQLSTQTTHDQQVIAQVSFGVDRIQWVLRELLGENNFYAVLPSDLGKLNQERKRKP